MTLCHCGKPLHYTSALAKGMTEKLIEMLGEYVPITVAGDGRTWRVQRHYIALHGIKAAELHTLGFEEIKS